MSNAEGYENNAVAAQGNETFVIFATNCDNADAAVALADLEEFGVNVKACKGAYTMRDTGETIQEDAWIVNAKHYHHPVIQDLIHGKRSMPYAAPQESILILGPRATRDGFRPAILQFLNSEALPEFLGYFVNVSEEVARANGQWTEDSQGFWIAAHDPERAIEDSNPTE